MVVQFTQWLIRWRYLVLLGTILVALFLASGGRFLTFTNDYRVFFSPENPQLQAFENLQNTYTKNDNLLFMLEPKDGKVFTPATLKAVVELTEEAWQLPYSIRVDSISNFQHTSASGDDLTVEDLITDPANLNNAELQRIKEIAINEPLLRNRLISPKGHVTGVNVTIQFPAKDLTAETPEVVAAARKLLEKVESNYPNINFYVTGVVMLNNAFAEASLIDFQTLVPLAYVAIIVGLLVFLRSISGTIVTVIVILMSILAAMGTAGWMGVKLTPPSSTAPTMIMTLAVADCIHLLVTFLYNMRHGMSKNDAIVESMRVNFQPVFLTSLTTALGFLSLNFSDVPPFNDLGNISAMGVVYAFFFAIFFLPAFLAVVPVRVKARDANGKTMINHFAEKVIVHRKTLLWAMSLIAIVFSVLITKNELNDVFVEYFDESIQFRTDTDHITQELTGMYFIDYSLESKSGSVSDPDFMQKVAAFKQWYEQQPEVLHVGSYTTIMQRLNKNMHGDDPKMYTLPDNQALAAQYLLLYEMSLPYGLDLTNQISIDKSATRFSVLLQTISSNNVIGLEDRAGQWLTENAPDLYTEGASPSVMFSHIGQRNIKSMLVGTTIALFLISFVLVITLRSVKYGLLSLFPNLLPAAIAFGLWGILVGQVGLALSVVTGMTLGIIVDDTIHFLSKYLRARREKNLSSQDAVRYAFSTVGVALIVTTLVLVAGFLTLSLSSFELNAGMGLLTAITIAIALIVDFLLLPPLLMAIED